MISPEDIICVRYYRAACPGCSCVAESARPPFCSSAQRLIYFLPFMPLLLPLLPSRDYTMALPCSYPVVSFLSAYSMFIWGIGLLLLPSRCLRINICQTMRILFPPLLSHLAASGRRPWCHCDIPSPPLPQLMVNEL